MDGPVDEAFLFHLHERDLMALNLRQQLDGLLDPSFYGGALLPDPDRVERNEPALPGRGQLQTQPAAASLLVSRAAAVVPRVTAVNLFDRLPVIGKTPFEDEEVVV